MPDLTPWPKTCHRIMRIIQSRKIAFRVFVEECGCKINGATQGSSDYNSMWRRVSRGLKATKEPKNATKTAGRPKQSVDEGIQRKAVKWCEKHETK